MPVGDDQDSERWQRGCDSLNSSDSEYEGHRHVPGAFNASDSDSESEYGCVDTGSNDLNTFDPSAEPAGYSASLDAEFAF